MKLFKKSVFDKAKCSVKWHNMLSEIYDSRYGVIQGGRCNLNSVTDLPTNYFRKYCSVLYPTCLACLVIMYLFFAGDLILFVETPAALREQLA